MSKRANAASAYEEQSAYRPSGVTRLAFIWFLIFALLALAGAVNTSNLTPS